MKPFTNVKPQYRWSVVGLDGDVVDILVQSGDDTWAAPRLFRKTLKSYGAPRRIMTDELWG